MDSIRISDAEKCRYDCDVSFVGSLYNEKHNFFDRLIEKADNYLIGYLEGLMNSQRLVYGCNFLATCLTDEIVQKIYAVMPYKIEEISFATLPYVYANYFLCRKITSMERIKLITEIANEAKTFLFTKDSDARLGKAVNKGKLDYYRDMPKVFKRSKINLNITLKSIQTGIPLRAMDIMGAGGFLMTNYQEDFLLHFEPDTDYVYYGSEAELLDKVRFYLKHDKERETIARSGYAKVAKYHTYQVRLQEMFELASKS